MKEENRAFDKERLEIASFIFDNAENLSYEQKVEYLSVIEDIELNVAFTVHSRVYYSDTFAHVIDEDYLITNIDSFSSKIDTYDNKQHVYYKKSNRTLPLKNKHFTLLIKTSSKNECDLISSSSDLLVYYFPDFSHELLEEYFMNYKMVILINDKLYLGHLDYNKMFTTNVNGKVITFNLNDTEDEVHFFPLLAVFL